MKNGNLKPKDRRRLERLRRELRECEERAYRMDGNDYDSDRLNNCYNSIYEDVKRLEKLNGE